MRRRVRDGGESNGRHAHDARAVVARQTTAAGALAADGRMGRSAERRVAAVVGQGGRPLAPAVRERVGARVESNLAHVRIHTGSDAARSAAVIGARAYTVGHDVVFGDGEFDPDSAEGQELLAHEATHTLQARTTSVPSTGLRVSDPHSSAERAASRSDTSSGVVASGTVHRQEEDWLAELAGPVGNWAGALNLGGSALQGIQDTAVAPLSRAVGQNMSAASPGLNALGGATSVLGLVTGGMTMMDDEAAIPDRVAGGLSAFSGATGTASWLGLESLAAGGTAGLGSSLGGAGGAFTSGAGAALGSLGAVAGAGAAGYGIGTMIAENTQVDEAAGDLLYDAIGPDLGLWAADTFGL